MTGSTTWGHVNSLCLPPKLKCSITRLQMRFNASFNAAFGSHIWQLMVMFRVFCRWLLAERALLWHQLSLGSVYSVLWHHPACDHRCPSTMPCIRGRPRRGSSWKPRRPSRSRSVSSPLSTFLRSHSSGSSSGHLSSTTRSMESAHSPSWALVPFAASRPPSDSPMPPLHSCIIN